MDIAARELAGRQEKVTRLAKTCAQQFANRIVLGTCTYAERAKDGLRIRGESRAYSFATLDAYARQCLQAGGEWRALDESSNEYRRARAEHLLRAATAP